MILIILIIMKLFDITEKEKIILYGLVKYPRFTDKQLSEKFNIKHSTVTSIRHRLFEEEYYRIWVVKC